MANQTPVSSLIGANLSATDSTALFALGTVCNTDDGARYEYVEATATFITGELVLVNPAGTAKTLISSLFTANADGYDIAACQGLLNQGEFGWVAKQGRNLYVLCTGTITAGNNTGVGLGANSGRLVVGALAGVGETIFGIFLTSSTPTTGGQNATQATLTWPRMVAKQ
jgi:hypothetical protein